MAFAARDVELMGLQLFDQSLRYTIDRVPEAKDPRSSMCGPRWISLTTVLIHPPWIWHATRSVVHA